MKNETGSHKLNKQTGIDIEVIEGKPPAWEQGCKLYQISTGRYTLTSLTPRAVDMINIIFYVATAAADKKFLVVAPKELTESGALAHNPKLKRLHDIPNATVINHADVKGVNYYEYHDISFVFGVEPPREEVERKAKRIYRRQTLSFEKEKTDVQKGGVTLKEVKRYTDQRVQRIYDNECEKTLMRAITLQRQMLHENRICYLFTSEPIGGLPTTPILFTLADVFACLDEQGNLDEFDAFLEKQADS